MTLDAATIGAQLPAEQRTAYLALLDRHVNAESTRRLARYLKEHHDDPTTTDTFTPERYQEFSSKAAAQRQLIDIDITPQEQAFAAALDVDACALFGHEVLRALALASLDVEGMPYFLCIVDWDADIDILKRPVAACGLPSPDAGRQRR
jgi:hypothetical protein